MNPTERAIETRWTAAMQTEGLAKNTIRRRTGTLERIQRDLRKPAIDLGIDEITSWLQRFGVSGTRAAYFQDLEAFYAWAELAGLVDDDHHTPTDRIKRPRQPKRLPRPISTEELFLGLDTATGDVLDWIKLGAYQGCRVSETAAVAGENLTGPSIRIFGKGDSDKTIPLHPEIATIAALRPRRGWWFPGTGASGHITAHHIAEKVVQHFEGLGVHGFTYHRLRHWCATEMLRAGASLPEVQFFMRHEVITSTVLYTRVLSDEVAVAAARLPRRAVRPLAAVS